MVIPLTQGLNRYISKPQISQMISVVYQLFAVCILIVYSLYTQDRYKSLFYKTGEMPVLRRCERDIRVPRKCRFYNDPLYILIVCSLFIDKYMFCTNKYMFCTNNKSISP